MLYQGAIKPKARLLKAPRGTPPLYPAPLKRRDQESADPRALDRRVRRERPLTYAEVREMSQRPLTYADGVSRRRESDPWTWSKALFRLYQGSIKALLRLY